MGGMKQYFKYKMGLSCGIQSITLEGIPDDWIEIRSRVDKLKDYGLSEWASVLGQIID
jgi:hypothetical protein